MSGRRYLLMKKTYFFVECSGAEGDVTSCLKEIAMAK